MRGCKKELYHKEDNYSLVVIHYLGDFTDYIEEQASHDGTIICYLEITYSVCF